MNKHAGVWTIVLFIVASIYAEVGVHDEPLTTIVISNAHIAAEPTKIFVGVIGESASFLSDFQRCLNWSGRFAATYKQLEREPSKKSEIQDLFKDEYDCALFLKFDENKNTVEWRLYDTALGTMVQGKRQALVPYRVAGEIVHALTNEPQPFLSKIAYRKRDRKRGVTSLVVTDFDGSHPTKLLESRRILVSLHWNSDPDFPLLLFSEFTPNNVRLLMADMQGHKAVVLDVEGTTAGVCYAPETADGKGVDGVVYCHSGAIWYHHYDNVKKKSVHTRIIHEKATCSSPTLLGNGDVIYCSKGSIKRYSTATKQSEVIIGGGYCVSPAYSAASHKIAYSKKVSDTMQLFVFDIIKGTHEQVTFASKQKHDKDFKSNKLDPCWAPDGINLVFGWERGEKQRIAILDTTTHQYEFITSENEQCSFPTWSINVN